MDYEKLADLNSKIWFFHDAEDFEGVSTVTKEFFLELGYQKNVEKAADLVAKAYKLYDEGWKIYPKKDSSKFFKQGLKAHLMIRELLGENKLTGNFHHWWWMEFGLKRYPIVFFWLFVHHLIRFRSINLVKAYKASLLLANAGIKGHDKRDILKAKEELISYWKYLFSNNICEKLMY